MVKNQRLLDTFRNLSLGLKFLAGQVLYLLITITGLVFFIIPGVYLGVRYAFISFCQIAGEESLSQSFPTKRNTKHGQQRSLAGNHWDTSSFQCDRRLLSGNCLFITIPISTLTMTAVYKQVSE